MVDISVLETRTQEMGQWPFAIIVLLLWWM